ncbi:hypothetical protein ACWEGV_14070, partial [Streptomyces sp. NPDC004976]
HVLHGGRPEGGEVAQHRVVRCRGGRLCGSAWIGRLEQDGELLLWVRVDWLRAGAGRPAGKEVKAYRATGVAAGDAAPGGSRRRVAAPA